LTKVKKMSEDKTIQYKIIGKNGEVIDDQSFNDYDKLADHMLSLAEKWYTGLYDADDSLEISTFDKTGELIYTDTATFGETMDEQSNLEDDLKQIVNIRNESAGQGFGDPPSKSRKKNKKN
jgi:hypothetical protein